MAETALKRILRVFVSRKWPAEPTAPWTLLGDDGSPVDHGESEPARWPVAEETEAVISADQMVWHRLRVPENLPHGELGRVLANALEEKLLGDAESQHFTLTSRRGEEARVLVVSRKRMSEIVGRFAAIGRPLSDAFSELQTAPAGEDGWHLTLCGETAILRREAGDGVVIDIEDKNAPPQLLLGLLKAGAAEARPLPRLILHAPPAAELPDLAAWQKATGLGVTAGPPYRWHAFADRPVSLLHGEFLPAHRRLAFLGSIRPALWLAGAVLAIDLLFNAVQVGWERYRLSEIQDSMASMFKSAFPNTPVVAPAMQIRKELDRLRAPAGKLTGDDALTLLAVVSEYLDPGIRERIERIRYEDKALEMTLGGSGRPDIGTLARQLDIRGYGLGEKTGDGGKSVLIMKRKTL